MTKSGARKVLEEWAARVAGVSEETLGWRVWHHDFVEPFHAAILEVEPFSSLKFAWLFGPDDSGELLDTRLPRWLIQKLQSGTAPEKIIEQVEAEISENVSHLCDVTAIFGADIDAEVELKNGIKLIPSGRIPERWHDQKVQRPLNESWFDPHDCCLLVQEISVTPAVKFRKSLQEEPNSNEAFTNPPQNDRVQILEPLRAAFLLAGSNAIELPARTIVEEGDRLLVVSGFRTGSLAPGHLPRASKFESAKIQGLFSELSKFGEREPLLRAIDRIGRSRMDRAPADQALDLGIAAEILLMHGSQDGNAEITNKLSMRAAWLLGMTVDERAETAKRTKNLYSARSKVAHTGNLSDPAKFDRSAADQLVSDVARVILSRGSFPKWETLCLGG